jgi:hypothetical protein
MHLMIRRANAPRFGVPSAAVVVAAFALLLIAPASSAATTISTVSSWTNQYIESFGDPNTATYGQVVTAPAGQNSLESFTFYLHVPTGLAFRPYVYAWDGEKATGPDLYEGPDLHTSEYVPGVYSAMTATTGGVPVTPSDRYVIFFSVSKDKTIDEGTREGGEWAWVASSAYTGGSTVWMNNGYKPEEWTVPGEIEIFPGEFVPNSWERETAHDMEFSAVFGVSPAISSVTPSSVSEGAQVTITGANFSGATQVLFGDTPAGSFTIDSDGQITAVVCPAACPARSTSGL